MSDDEPVYRTMSDDEPVFENTDSGRERSRSPPPPRPSHFAEGRRSETELQMTTRVVAATLEALVDIMTRVEDLEEAHVVILSLRARVVAAEARTAAAEAQIALLEAEEA